MNHSPTHEHCNGNPRGAETRAFDPRAGSSQVGNPLGHSSKLGERTSLPPRTLAAQATGNPRGSVRIATYENAALNARLTVIRNGTRHWFEAAGVCRALDVCESVLRRLDPDERIALAVPQAGGVRLLTLVSESGLLALCGLFTLCGRDVGKPSEPAFRKWVVYELLPVARGHVVDVESVSVSVNGKGGAA